MCLNRILLLSVILGVGHGFGLRLWAQGEISVGMSREKVIETLGEPIGTLREGRDELLIYRGVEIRLVRNQVEQINQLNKTLLPSGQGVTVKPPPPPPPPPQPVAAPPAPPVVAPEAPIAEVPPAAGPPAVSAFAKLLDGQAAKLQPSQFTTSRKIFLGCGLFIFGVGFLVALGGSLWLLVRAFVVHIGWGLACLLIPIAQIAFLICHWREGRHPFFVSLAGAAGALLGVVVAFGFGVMPAMAAGGANAGATAVSAPGSLANETLIRDAMPSAMIYAGALGCAKPTGVERVEVLRQPEGAPNGMRWEERWFIGGCGKEFPIDLIFQEDGRGGAFFDVRAAK